MEFSIRSDYERSANLMAERTWTKDADCLLYKRFAIRYNRIKPGREEAR